MIIRFYRKVINKIPVFVVMIFKKKLTGFFLYIYTVFFLYITGCFSCAGQGVFPVILIRLRFTFEKNTAMSVPNYIQINDAVQMRDLYKTTNGPLLKVKSPSNDYIPTDFVWIPLTELKAIVDEYYAIHDKDNKPISGVRIYFGLGKDSENKDRETVFLTPTSDYSDASPVPVDPKLCNLPVSVVETPAHQIEFQIIDSLKNAADITVKQLPVTGTVKNNVCDSFQTVPPPATTIQ